MRALTLLRPWCYAFTHSDKDIENRTWPCYLEPGTQFALHSGAKSGWDKQGVDFLRGLGLTAPSKSKCPASEIFAVVTFQGNVSSSDSKWFFGPVGWVLSDLIILPEPVAIKGALGLWRIPAPEFTQVMRQIQNR